MNPERLCRSPVGGRRWLGVNVERRGRPAMAHPDLYGLHVNRHGHHRRGVGRAGHLELEAVQPGSDTPAPIPDGASSSSAGAGRRARRRRGSLPLRRSSSVAADGLPAATSAILSEARRGSIQTPRARSAFSVDSKRSASAASDVAEAAPANVVIQPVATIAPKIRTRTDDRKTDFLSMVDRRSLIRNLRARRW